MVIRLMITIHHSNEWYRPMSFFISSFLPIKWAPLSSVWGIDLVSSTYQAMGLNPSPDDRHMSILSQLNIYNIQWLDHCDEIIERFGIWNYPFHFLSRSHKDFPRSFAGPLPKCLLADCCCCFFFPYPSYRGLGPTPRLVRFDRGIWWRK